MTFLYSVIQIKDLHKKMIQIYDGANLCSISGINDKTMLCLLGEVGTVIWAVFLQLNTLWVGLGWDQRANKAGK